MPIWRSLELEPLRYTAAFIPGPSGDLTIGQPLLAQSVEHVEYFLAGLPMHKTGATAMCGSVNNCILRKNCPAGGAPGKAHLFFDGRAKVLDQMKPIGDLLGLRCAFTSRLRVQAAAVPADNFDGRMVTQPLGSTLDAPIVQDVDDRPALEVDHDGSVARRSPPTPIIDTDHPYLGVALSNHGIPLQLPQDGVITDGHAEPLHQPLARKATGAVAEQADNLPDPSRPTRVWTSYRRQSVGERLSCAFPMYTSPAAQQELHCHRLALGRQILEAAAGPAMLTSASPSTIGANADGGSSSGNNPPVVNSERDTQNLHPWAG